MPKNFCYRNTIRLTSLNPDILKSEEREKMLDTNKLYRNDDVINAYGLQSLDERFDAIKNEKPALDVMQYQLFRMAAKGNLEPVRFLCELANRDLNAVEGVTGGTALHYAVMHNHHNVASYLINEGAHVNIKDVQGNAPLCYAADWRMKGILTDARIEINAEELYFANGI